MLKRLSVSSKKPENKNKRPEPVIDWNNKTEESYVAEGFDLEECPHAILESNSEQKRFLSQVEH